MNASPSVAAPSTFTQYAAFTRRNAPKARRYQRSITETLERTTIHDLERQRLEQALAGIASVLGESTTCRRCHRALSDPTSVAAGYGHDCAERLAVAS